MLTAREMDVLKYLALGKTREEVGLILGIAHSAVAMPGEPYAVSFPVNPLSDLPGDKIVSVDLSYSADFGGEKSVPMTAAAKADVERHEERTLRRARPAQGASAFRRPPHHQSCRERQSVRAARRAGDAEGRDAGYLACVTLDDGTKPTVWR